jgi:hypothetical protein
MTDAATEAPEVQPDPETPDPLEALRDKTLERLTGEVSKATLNANSIELVKALVEVFKTAEGTLRERRWEAQATSPEANAPVEQAQDNPDPDEEVNGEVVGDKPKKIKKNKKEKK